MTSGIQTREKDETDRQIGKREPFDKVRFVKQGSVRAHDHDLLTQNLAGKNLLIGGLFFTLLLGATHELLTKCLGSTVC